MNGATLPGPALGGKHAPHTGAPPTCRTAPWKTGRATRFGTGMSPPLLHRRRGGHPFNLSRAFTVPVQRPEHEKTRPATSEEAADRAQSCPAAQTSSVTVPPAAVIFSLAEPETASTETCSATEISPCPRTLTRWLLRTAPLATRSATVTSPPSG